MLKTILSSPQQVHRSDTALSVLSKHIFTLDAFNYFEGRLSKKTFNEISIPSEESEGSCFCVLRGIECASFYDLSVKF